MDPFEKTFEQEGGIIARNFPLEKGNSYHWTVSVKENIGTPGPALSFSVVTEQQEEDDWPAWGATGEGWALAFWRHWKKSFFSHNHTSVKDIDLVHIFQTGDFVEVYLSEEGELSFTLNGIKEGKFPYPLPWKETLYPAVFTYPNEGKVTLKIDVESGLGIKDTQVFVLWRARHFA